MNLLLLQCTSPELAQSGHRAMSDLSPQCALKRTSANAWGFMSSRPRSATKIDTQGA
jgi:hypothetical protein